jgi:hypothetical protein
MRIMKRLTPELYFKIFCLLYKKRIYEKHLDKLIKQVNIVVPGVK